METVVTTFDDVLHVVREPETRFHPKHTVFSFMAGGQYQPYVKVPGWPSIEPGTKVTALLKQPGNWKSVVGWVNHASGEISAPNFKRPAFGALFGAIWAGAWLVLCPAQFGPFRWAPPILGLLLCLADLAQARRERLEAMEISLLASALVANPSVELTNCGKPQSAAHLER